MPTTKYLLMLAVGNGGARYAENRAGSLIQYCPGVACSR